MNNNFRMRTSHKTLYLTFILSTVCIFLYQYHMSIPRIATLQQQSINEVRVALISYTLTTPDAKLTKTNNNGSRECIIGWNLIWHRIVVSMDYCGTIVREKWQKWLFTFLSLKSLKFVKIWILLIFLKKIWK
jgi:hypothetical protein